MVQEKHVQNFGGDEFSYLADRGNWCVIEVPARNLTADIGDQISIGDNGEEGTYWVWALLPLHPDSSTVERPTAVVLCDEERFAEPEGPGLFDTEQRI